MDMYMIHPMHNLKLIGDVTIRPNMHFALIACALFMMVSGATLKLNYDGNIIEFYKSVQQCVTVLPRVYLMIIVGTLLIEFKKADTKEVLEDLIESCNCVQHPKRGLFVRYFMLKI